MGPFWNLRRYLSEGSRWLERLVTLHKGLPAGPPSGPEDAERAARLTAARMWALLYAATFFRAQENLARAAQLGEEALAAVRAAEDVRAMVRALVGFASGEVMSGGDAARGRALYEEGIALARSSGNEHALLEVLLDFSYILTCAFGAHERAETVAGEALALARRLGSAYGESRAGCVLALAASRQGEVARAEALAAQALSLAQQQGIVQLVFFGLLVLAFTASQRGQSIRAARLLGAMVAWGVRAGAVLAPAEQTMIAEGTAAARTAVGEEAWEAAFAAGQALSQEEAIAEAVDMETI